MSSRINQCNYLFCEHRSKHWVCVMCDNRQRIGGTVGTGKSMWLCSARLVTIMSKRPDSIVWPRCALHHADRSARVHSVRRVPVSAPVRGYVPIDARHSSPAQGRHQAAQSSYSLTSDNAHLPECPAPLFVPHVKSAPAFSARLPLRRAGCLDPWPLVPVGDSPGNCVA